jgi:hypothetical protein
MSTYINKCYPNDNVSSPNKIENDDVIRMTTRTIRDTERKQTNAKTQHRKLKRIELVYV